MRLSTVVLPLALALAGACETFEASKALPAGLQHAKQFRRESIKLSARTDVDPEEVCGTDFNDCGNGWCCSADQECAGDIEDIPVCNDPSATFPLEGTAVASPYKNIESVFSSLMGELAEITGAASGSVQISMAEKTTTGTASSSSETGTVSNSGETGTASSSAEASNTSASAETGAAAALGGPGSFGQTVTMVMCVWGVAALGGAGWLLM